MRVRVAGIVAALIMALWGVQYGAEKLPGAPAQTTGNSQQGAIEGKAQSTTAFREWYSARIGGGSSGPTSGTAGSNSVQKSFDSGGGSHGPTKLSTRSSHESSIPVPNPDVCRRLSSRSGGTPAHYVADFEVTAYTNSPSDTGKSPGTPGYGITASGQQTVPGLTVAADWNVLPEGTVIQISGLPGTYEVQDTGSAITGHHIDLFVGSETSAVIWGVKKRKVTVLQWGGTKQ